jgi:long-subunit acyl-CoA synthetase (AMP-forming)
MKGSTAGEIPWLSGRPPGIPRDTAVILYAPAATGKPKCGESTHSNLAINA